VVELLEPIRTLLPLLAVAAFVLGTAHWLLIRRGRQPPTELPMARPLGMLALTGLAIVAVILALPVADATRAQLLSLLGLVLTAMIALSSTSFVANAMAGLLLRVLGNFRPGDFVRVGDQFGRVTERGLFHTELQTEDRDLSTPPPRPPASRSPSSTSWTSATSRSGTGRQGS
jgi:small conductance mechanosensitive channel